MSTTELDRWTNAQQVPPLEDVPGPTAGGPLTEHDMLGRRRLHRPYSLPFWLLFICRIDPARVRRVPAVAIVEEGVDDALLSCPCGARPVVGSELAQCVGCERYYTRIDVGHVYVAYGAMTPPPLPTAPRQGD